MNALGKRMVDISDGLEDVPVICKDPIFPTFKYCPDNVQGPGCGVDPSEVTLPGCSCLSRSCCPESCSCLQTGGQAYHTGGALLDLNRTGSDYSSPVFECNALCSCSDACSNRVVQKGLQLSLEIFPTSNRGWGVRTLQEIPCGTFVCEYAGEVVGFVEAKGRQLCQSAEENNYIIAVMEHAGSGSVTKTFVDPTRVGNVGRFLNHSCQPNLVMVPVRVHSVIPSLALFAARDIRTEEELTFDYSGGCRKQQPATTQSPAVAEARRPNGQQRKPCRCGAKDCTGFLPLDLSILS